MLLTTTDEHAIDIYKDVNEHICSKETIYIKIRGTHGNRSSKYGATLEVGASGQAETKQAALLKLAEDLKSLATHVEAYANKTN